jgi:hypothetical protein
MFERDVALYEIAEKSSIKDESSISRKARIEVWKKGKMQLLVAK